MSNNAHFSHAGFQLSKRRTVMLQPSLSGCISPNV
jgi:hypothetical protein